MYSNEAQCYLSEKLGRRAVEPAQKAVDADPTNEKAWRRLALGHAARKESALGHLEETRFHIRF